MSEPKITVIIAAHKAYRMPEDPMYLPLQVGASGKESIGFTRDDTGENISVKNPFYSELTGLYWAWKNLDADYVGLVHYRRHFTLSAGHFKTADEKFAHVLKEAEARNILEKTPVIVPKMRKYYIETLYDHYRHTMYVEPLDLAGEILKTRYPEYAEAFEKLKTRTSAHMFNMMIMRKDLLDEYCGWLFDILEELEERTAGNSYGAFHARFFGRVSELLLDVFLEVRRYPYTEVRVLDMEKVNWIKKGGSFLLAKLFGRKYKKSF